MSVATIIVNYNAGETLQECVAALLNSNVHTRVTVVDNASNDKSEAGRSKQAVFINED